MRLRVPCLVITSLAVAAAPLWAIVGCLTEEKELAPRAEVIVRACVLQVEQVDIEPCPSPEFVPCDPNDAGLPGMTSCWRASQKYFECGRVSKLRARVSSVLKG